MTPIERVQERAKAAALLDVSLYATKDELKLAWKRVGFQTHPDRDGGNEAAFLHAQAAFELLLDTMDYEDLTEPEPVKETPSRTVKPRRVSSNLGPGIGS